MKKAKPSGKEITIVGVVEEYEEEGRIGVIISTDENDDYVVELNKQGKRLSQEIDSDVEVTGFVTKSSDGTKRITVTKFDVLDFDDDDEDDIFYDDDDDDAYYDDDDDTRRWL